MEGLIFGILRYVSSWIFEIDLLRPTVFSDKNYLQSSYYKN